MPSMKTILQVATVTVATMFLMNQVAARVPMARRLIKGTMNSVPTGTTSQTLSV